MSYRTSTGDEGGFQLFRSSANGMSFDITGATNYHFTDGNLSSMQEGVWAHVAVTRQDGYIRMFVNGFMTGYDANFNHNIPPSANDLVIGRHSDNAPYDFQGYLDEIRISKGIARWTENFIPPTEPYTT
jgi:hypothetical protein